jgi:FSR family fosmidomycin resistance protein-like MFS transporter
MAGLTTTFSIPSPSTTHPHPRRTLIVAGFAHALHDGYTDLIYVLLPVWQAEFALGYGVLAFVRGLYTGAMAGLQIPVGRLAERLGGRIVLALGTALAALGYALAGFSGGLLGLCVALSQAQGPARSTRSPLPLCHARMVEQHADLLESTISQVISERPPSRLQPLSC